VSHVLTIPDQKIASSAVANSGGTNGQGDLTRELAKHPLARSELGKPNKLRTMDHIHLGRFDGTDYCQWWGRCADGYHRPIGRIMQIVVTSPVPPTEGK
jgi:hypothetical protein